MFSQLQNILFKTKSVTYLLRRYFEQKPQQMRTSKTTNNKSYTAYTASLLSTISLSPPVSVCSRTAQKRHSPLKKLVYASAGDNFREFKWATRTSSSTHVGVFLLKDDLFLGHFDHESWRYCMPYRKKEKETELITDIFHILQPAGGKLHALCVTVLVTNFIFNYKSLFRILFTFSSLQQRTLC